jgi:hypothetical protein
MGVRLLDGHAGVDHGARPIHSHFKSVPLFDGGLELDPVFAGPSKQDLATVDECSTIAPDCVDDLAAQAAQ